MRILIVWEEIPETTKFYVVDYPSAEQLKMLDQAHGLVINCDDTNEGMEYLSNALSCPEYADASLPGASIWHQNQKDVQQVKLAGPYERVYWSGFAL